MKLSDLKRLVINVGDKLSSEEYELIRAEMLVDEDGRFKYEGMIVSFIFVVLKKKIFFCRLQCRLDSEHTVVLFCIFTFIVVIIIIIIIANKHFCIQSQLFFLHPICNYFFTQSSRRTGDQV